MVDFMRKIPNILTIFRFLVLPLFFMGAYYDTPMVRVFLVILFSLALYFMLTKNVIDIIFLYEFRFWCIMPMACVSYVCIFFLLHVNMFSLYAYSSRS